jgi:hypothetical protein
MKISDLPTGKCSVNLFLRKSGKTTRSHGIVVEKKSSKCLITRQSPKKSYGPGTQVLWYRKVVREIK